MIDRTISHYRILAKLGGGGMGVVYEAEDESLHRRVALKFLPDHLAQNSEALQRFEFEARAASALNHPNICVIHEIGKDEERPFIVMELIKGATLKDRIEAKSLRVDETIELAIQIADALDAAHSQGIIHRDIKPANIFITTRGQIKLADFGLAKRVSSPAMDSQQPTATMPDHSTQPGFAMGTLSYMSPEQLRGKELDPRTDLFSFGVVLYEMLTGALPFSGKSSPEVIDAIFNQAPISAARLNADVYPDLQGIVSKALEKDPNLRYQNADEMRRDLQRLKKTISSRVAGQLQSQANPKTKRGLTIFLQVTVAVLMLLAGAWIFRSFRNTTNSSTGANTEIPTSIAVLPFADLSAAKDQEYFSDGLAEQILSDLSQVEGLRVAGRTSSFQFKGKNEDLREIGKKLNVGAILEGSVRKEGNQLRVTAQLINVEDGFHLWSQTYDRALNDVFAVQEDISRRIVSVFRLKYAAKAKHSTENTEAYQLYLQGRFHWNRYTEQGFRKSIEYFRQAVAKDPDYALAYSGMADSYSVMAGDGIARPHDVMPSALEAARKALEIDPDLAEAHTSLGIYKMLYEWDWSGAEREFSRSLELKPNDPDTYHFYGHLRQAMGRQKEAIAFTLRGVQLDPLSLILNAELAYAHYLARDYDRAIEIARRTIQMDREFVYSYWILALSLFQKGMFEEALEQMRLAKEMDNWPFIAGEMAQIYARSGRPDQARKILTELQIRSTTEFIDSAIFAFIYVALGDEDQAYLWLEKIFEERSFFACVTTDPKYDPVRNNPRFVALLKRAGIS